MPAARTAKNKTKLELIAIARREAEQQAALVKRTQEQKQVADELKQNIVYVKRVVAPLRKVTPLRANSYLSFNFDFEGKTYTLDYKSWFNQHPAYEDEGERPGWEYGWFLTSSEGSSMIASGYYLFSDSQGPKFGSARDRAFVDIVLSSIEHIQEAARKRRW